MKWISLILVLSIVSVAFLRAVIAAESSEQQSKSDSRSKDENVGVTSVVATPNTEENNGDATIEDEGDNDNAMYIQYAGTEDPDDPTLFKPTAEWQQIKPGQKIPKGLHIRMNLQTGLKEAKLLDKNEDADGTVSDSTSVAAVEQDGDGDSPAGSTSTNPEMEAAKKRMEEALRDAAKELELGKDSLHYWKEGEKEGMMNLKKQTFSKEELRDALKKFKATRDDVQDEKLREESLKKSFRSYEELKKDFETINMGIKTDQEIVTQLVNSYKDKEIAMTKKLGVLDELEYMLHQVDNALHFVDIGGFDLIAKELNSTDQELRSQALLVLGGALQSNPKVQVHAVEGGVLHQLVRMVATETDANLLNRVIYSSSTLLRHFPFAQNKFFQVGGLHAVTNIMGNSETPPKVKVKILTLVNDLITERKLMSQHSNPDSEGDNLKLQQYSEYNLEKLLEELSWCSYLPPLLNLPEHDKREKVLIAMTTVQDICQFKEDNVRTLLSSIKTEYEKLSESEALEDDKYFTGVLNIVDTLIKTIATTNTDLKDEL